MCASCLVRKIDAISCCSKYILQTAGFDGKSPARPKQPPRASHSPSVQPASRTKTRRGTGPSLSSHPPLPRSDVACRPPRSLVNSPRLLPTCSFQNYTDYFKCIAAKGEDYAPCKQFKRAYNSLCPSMSPLFLRLLLLIIGSILSPSGASNSRRVGECTVHASQALHWR